MAKLPKSTSTPTTVESPDRFQVVREKMDQVNALVEELAGWGRTLGEKYGLQGRFHIIEVSNGANPTASLVLTKYHQKWGIYYYRETSHLRPEEYLEVSQCSLNIRCEFLRSADKIFSDYTQQVLDFPKEAGTALGLGQQALEKIRQSSLIPHTTGGDGY